MSRDILNKIDNATAGTRDALNKQRAKNKQDKCSACGKKLDEFKYEQDSGFCSEECRQQSLTKKDETEKKSKKLIEKGKSKIDDLKKSYEELNELLYETIDDIAEFKEELEVELVEGVDNRLDKLVNKSRISINKASDLHNTVLQSGIIMKINEVNTLLEGEINKEMSYVHREMYKLNEFIGNNINSGYTDSLINKIKPLLKSIESLRNAYDSAWNTAYELIVSIIPPSLEPDSINFVMTIKSNLFYPGSMANKLPNKNLSLTDSSINFINQQKVVDILDEQLSNITNETLISDVEQFKAILNKSSVRQKNIKALIDSVKGLIMLISEPLPKYENIKLTNLRYVLWASTCFGPTGQKHFGLPF